MARSGPGKVLSLSVYFGLFTYCFGLIPFFSGFNLGSHAGRISAQSRCFGAGEPELMYKLFDEVMGRLEDLVQCLCYDGEIKN